MNIANEDGIMGHMSTADLYAEHFMMAIPRNVMLPLFKYENADQLTMHKLFSRVMKLMIDVYPLPDLLALVMFSAGDLVRNYGNIKYYRSNFDRQGLNLKVLSTSSKNNPHEITMMKQKFEKFMYYAFANLCWTNKYGTIFEFNPGGSIVKCVTKCEGCVFNFRQLTDGKYEFTYSSTPPGNYRLIYMEEDIKNAILKYYVWENGSLNLEKSSIHDMESVKEKPFYTLPPNELSAIVMKIEDIKITSTTSFYNRCLETMSEFVNRK